MATNNYYFGEEENDSGPGLGTALGATALAGLAATPLGRPLRNNLRQLGGKIDGLANGHISQAGRGLSDNAKEVVDTMLAKRALAKGGTLDEVAVARMGDKRKAAQSAIGDFLAGSDTSLRGRARQAMADVRATEAQSIHGPESWRNMPALAKETWAGARGLFGRAPNPERVQALNDTVDAVVRADGARYQGGLLTGQEVGPFGARSPSPRAVGGSFTPSVQDSIAGRTLSTPVIDEVVGGAQRTAVNARASAKLAEELPEEYGAIVQAAQKMRKDPAYQAWAAGATANGKMLNPARTAQKANAARKNLSQTKSLVWDDMEQTLNEWGFQPDPRIRDRLLLMFSSKDMSDAAALRPEVKEQFISQLLASAIQ